MEYKEDFYDEGDEALEQTVQRGDGSPWRHSMSCPTRL